VTDAPKIEFPCRYPIKIVGSNTIDFVARVTSTVRAFDSELSEDDVSVRMSSANKFCSVTCVIMATGEPQLKSLHMQLREIEEVSLVL
jgi:putative lipoic acid-binding regulatory protein